MHYFNGGWFWGMHLLWWLFWVAVIVGLVALVRSGGPRSRPPDTPLQVLQRRYAAGEISTQEYEERRAVLERDAASPR